MKNCPNCNVQYEDSINFCQNCGSALDVVEEVCEPAPKAEYKPNVLFTFLYKVFAVLSTMFGLCSLASPYLNVSINSSYYSSSFYASESFGYDTATAVFALLLALGTLAFAILTFIQGLIKKGGKEALFDGIVRLVTGTALLIFSIVLLAHVY